MKISATDVVLVAKDAGFEGNQLRIAIAVSFAEVPSHETTARGPKVARTAVKATPAGEAAGAFAAWK